MSKEKTSVFRVTSNFDQRTQKPFVMVTVDEKNFSSKMSTLEARNLALQLLFCADSSESDTFMIMFLRKKAGLDDLAIARLLKEFREWRDQNIKAK